MLMQLTRTISAALIAGAAILVGGAEPQSRPLSLDDCIQLALQHNLDIQITRRTPEIARLSLSGAYGGYDPSFSAGYRHSFSSRPGGLDEFNRVIPSSESDTDNFNLGLGGVLPTGLSYSLSGDFSDTLATRPLFDAQGNPIGTLSFGDASSFAGISLRQPLLRNFWTDGNRLNIAIAKSNLKFSELVLRQQIMATVTQVEESYYRLIAARDAVKVQEMALELAERLLSENRKRVEVGVLAPLDEREAESQVEASKAALLGARNTVSVRQNALKNLITDMITDWQDVGIEPSETLSATPQTFSRQDSWEKGLTLRPDLLQSKVDLERRNITLRYNKNQMFPQLDLVGSYGRIGNSTEFSGALGGIVDGSGPQHSYGAQLTIPLSNRAARQRYRVSKEEIEQALLRLKQLEQNIMVEIDDAISGARTSLEQVVSTRASVEFAEQALRAEQKKLENGKSTSFQVLRLQRDLTLRQYEYLSSLTTYNIALAQLAFSEGTALERHAITLEVR